MLDFLQGRRGCRRPDKRTRVLVVVANILVDGAGQFGKVSKRSTPDALAGKFGKSPLGQVQPGGPGRGTVQVVARVSRTRIQVFDPVKVLQSMNIELHGRCGVRFDSSECSVNKRAAARRVGSQQASLHHKGARGGCRGGEQ